MGEAGEYQISSPEQVTTHEDLWNKASVLTISVRRHGAWESEPPHKRMAGSLTPEAIKETRRAAKIWIDRLPEGFELSIFQSPSNIPVRVQKAGDTVIRPMRAGQTASIYEIVCYGGLKKSGSDPHPRRRDESLLGDFLETAQDEAKVKDFLNVRGEEYPSIEEFWSDYLSGNLRKKTRQALEGCNGLDSKSLANNLFRFVQKEMDKFGNIDRPYVKKHATIAITHGEVIESFLQTISRFVETKDQNSSLAEKLRKIRIGYDEGIDIHVNEHGTVIIQLTGHSIRLSQSEFERLFKT